MRSRNAAFRALLLVAGACIAFHCVDVPATGPSQDQFDFRATVRYIYLARGIDTVAYFLHADTTKATTTSTRSTGTVTIHDTVRTTSRTRVYLRYTIDRANPVTLSVDGAAMGTLAYGSATSYFNSAAGNRAVTLRSTGVHIDTLTAIDRDSVHHVQYDTIATSKHSTDDYTVSSHVSRLNLVSPLSGAVPLEANITADSTSPTSVFTTNTKFTICITAPLLAPTRINGQLLHYGWASSVQVYERESFNTTGIAIPDSCGIRFFNGATNGSAAGKKIRIRAVAPDTGSYTKDTLAFAASTPYKRFHSGSFTISVFKLGSNVAVDSLVNVGMITGRRYTVAVIDKDSTYTLRTYEDE